MFVSRNEHALWKWRGWGGGAQIEETKQKYPDVVKDRTVKSILESIQSYTRKAFFFSNVTSSHGWDAHWWILPLC